MERRQVPARQSRPRAGQAAGLRGHDGLDPDLRFDKHKAGIQANRFVQQWGLRLRPELYERHNPMTYDEARRREVELGIALRRAGYAVWQG